MVTVLITGANRGLGLEFTRQYLAEGASVIAACRDPGRATALRALKGALEILPLDVGSATSIQALGVALGNRPIDVLLLNAAVHLQKDCTLASLDAAKWLAEFEINTVAPVMLARALTDNVANSAGRKIVSISSGSGSITNLRDGGNYAYRAGKAATNAAMRMLSHDLAPRGIIVTSIAPGHTRTDMGGDNAPYSAEDSVARVRGVIARLTLKDSGAFLSRDGTITPW